jgi:DD-carboxypeptidase, putative
MTNTKWFNASGAAAVSFKGYYTPQRYNNYVSNQTTARDLGILVYNFVKNYPDILNYTNQAKVTVKAGTPYEETFETYNYSLPGARYALEGVDGLKTGSSPNGAFNYIATVKRGNQRVIGVIMGVGDWSDQDGEYYRHPFGNALIEKSYADYEYKKLFSKGKQEIDGKTYNLPEDFYATIKKDAKAKPVVENGVLKAGNDLYTLSPKISDEMKVEEVDASVTQSAKEEVTKKENNKTWYSDLLSNRWLIALPIVIIILIFYIENRKSRKAKAAARKQRFK